MTDSELAIVIDHAADPFSGLKDAATDMGLTENQVKELIAKVNISHSPVITELKAVKTSQFTDLIEDRAHTALEKMTPEKMEKSSPKDLAIITGILLEKRAMLRGEPTHIISVTERAQLNELGPMLIQEMERRGLSVLNTVGAIEAGAPSPEQMARGRSQHRGIVGRKKLKVAREKVEIGEG